MIIYYFFFFFFFFFLCFFFFFFFFQAEDGIRDGRVTGVQTCALPISSVVGAALFPLQHCSPASTSESLPSTSTITDWRISALNCGSWSARTDLTRSEERRVGKECRSRWWPEH